MDDKTKRQVDIERTKILEKWDDWFEIPLIILGFCWLVLIIIELTYGLSPLLETLSWTIWIIFIFDFVVRFFLAPHKGEYFKNNWLNLLALAVPALRFFRIFRLFRFAPSIRSVYLLKIFSSIRRGMQILGATLGRHGFGYIMGLTFLVILLGAAGIYTFESQPGGEPGFKDYGAALWWTAMIVTTMGSDMWPKTTEGRVLCLALAIYAFAIFGYVAATVASFLIEKDREEKKEVKILMKALNDIKAELQELKNKVPGA